MEAVLIKNATIVNEGKQIEGDLLIKDGRIEKIGGVIEAPSRARVIDAEGLHLLPGVIDDQVHFRDPGLKHKATIETESMAAVAGGVTSFMEMPNTRPPALTQEILEDKYKMANYASAANYSFFMGASNDNIEEVLKTNEKKKDVCGVKIFMGSSTGNMLVDDHMALNRIFADTELLIATHCEDERIINENKEKYSGADDVKYHPMIRDVEGCYQSSLMAVQLANKHRSRLHILHISTAKELQLFTNMFPLKEKKITAEVCVHHLNYTSDDYARLGTQIQCNPAIKSPEHREALWEALLDDRLDIIATDHAPHTWDEKQQPYPQSPSGVPLVQHSLLLMLKYVKEGRITLERVVEKMAHAPAICFQVEERGFIREGYYADLVLVDLKGSTTVTKENILYKCGWSPLEGETLPADIRYTLVNGKPALDDGKINKAVRGKRLSFVR